jgi:hypothetical protein
MNEQRSRLILPFAILGAIMAVSTASILIRFAQQNAPSLVIAAFRLTFASLILAPLALTRHRAAYLLAGRLGYRARPGQVELLGMGPARGKDWRDR